MTTKDFFTRTEQHDVIRRYTRKRDIFWYCLLTLTFLFTVFYLYFWLIVRNSFDDLNWDLFGKLKTWIPWYRVIRGLVCVTFTYLAVLVLMFIYFVLRGKPLRLHVVHIVITVLILVASLGVTESIDILWSSEWSTLLLSLQITGPFLQIGAVCLMTAVSWVISLQYFRISSFEMRVVFVQYLGPNCGLGYFPFQPVLHNWFNKGRGWKTFMLLVYLVLMLLLYLSPMLIHSPCVVSAVDLPTKPKLVAHRGASGILPENTLMSFQYAEKYHAHVYETDVRISYDGVPFLLHDKTFRRTTNIGSVFPERVDTDATLLNISEIKSLNAGSWFLNNNPMWTAGDLSDFERRQVANQTIPTLHELVGVVKNAGKRIMFDLMSPNPDHPFYNKTVQLVVNAIKAAGLSMEKVWWLEHTVNNSRPQGVTVVAEQYHQLAVMRRRNISTVNVQYSELTRENIEEYKKGNISVNIWNVNSPWFFSLYWCMGVHSVTTNMCHVMYSLHAPVWHLSPNSYMIMWMTVDILSVIIVIMVFVVQRIRMRGTSFGSRLTCMEKLNSSSDNTRQALNMKEKLLYDGYDSERTSNTSRQNSTGLAQPAYFMTSNTSRQNSTGSAQPAYSMTSMHCNGYRPSFHSTSSYPDDKYEME